ncbi:MAG: hypothetical protein Q9218_002470 [Villophora microphyllina]
MKVSTISAALALWASIASAKPAAQANPAASAPGGTSCSANPNTQAGPWGAKSTGEVQPAASTPTPTPSTSGSFTNMSIEYIGAGNAVYYDNKINDGDFFYIDAPFSVSTIRVDGDGICRFVGDDRSFTEVPDGEEKPVGPPQTQLGGYCFGW